MTNLKIILTGIYAFLVWLTYQLLLPPLNPGFLGGFVFFGIWVVIGTFLLAFWLSPEGEYYFIPPIVAIVLFVLILIIGNIASSSLFHATAMYGQLGEVKDYSFTEEILPLDQSQIPVVDADLAYKQGDKKLGEIPTLGSQVRVGNFTIQEVNGELIFVAPLEHTGFFKWMNNRTTPGYITVDATNPNDVELVQEIDGEPINLKYLRSCFMGEEITRYVRNSGYLTAGVTDYSFELDDNGRPYWVITKYENLTLWSSPEATGTIIVDAQTGEINEYSISDTPEWVDIIQPESFIDNQIDNWGDLVHGPFNFSNEDEFRKTPGMLTVYNDGTCYYYTGLTSVGNDDATIGFVMVDTRTKEAKRFLMSGATEQAAMRSAEGMVQDLGYTATEPVPLNLNGIPTYFMTLKDDEGLIKQYAMVNIESYSIVAVGDTISLTQSQYMSRMTATGNNVAFSEEGYSYKLTGTVTRISSNVEAGNTVYYLILNNDDTKLYVASYNVSPELPITREGDEVEISYIDTGSKTVTISTFENTKFALPVSEAQQQVDENYEQPIESDSNQIYDVNPETNEDYWNSLTDEEKAKLIEQAGLEQE